MVADSQRALKYHLRSTNHAAPGLALAPGCSFGEKQLPMGKKQALISAEVLKFSFFLLTSKGTGILVASKMNWNWKRNLLKLNGTGSVSFLSSKVWFQPERLFCGKVAS